LGATLISTAGLLDIIRREIMMPSIHSMLREVVRELWMDAGKPRTSIVTVKLSDPY
jgi:hypothetical protein